MTDLITGVSGADMFSDPAGSRYSWHRVASAASTNATSVKAAPGHVYGFYVGNVDTDEIRYLKFYDKASAPTVGTDTPIATIAIPISGQAYAYFPVGIPFAVGIAYAIVDGVTDASVVVVAANDVHGGLLYA